jgi:hypothetical protein
VIINCEWEASLEAAGVTVKDKEPAGTDGKETGGKRKHQEQ